MSFRVERVTHHDELFFDYLRVRYQVYCLERGFEDPLQHPGGIETDKYDVHAVHLAAVEEGTGQVVGCARIILHDPDQRNFKFPLEEHFALDSPLKSIDRDCIGEVSRLAVTKSHCQEFQIVSKLLDHLFLESGRLELTHWYAAMAKGLPVLLRRRKLNFFKAGPDAEFHGTRAPYTLDLERMAVGSTHFAYYQPAGEERVAATATA
ncbi:GNAT family N-acyltransferase [Geoalkalibacter halelectricus]|uniref:GNAT family N-acetyltransferase n=1 Tax=Geoalkalibacter halelectricus TaxID=2847045 RepID=A0ABY5ZKQ8_9BACT|nr:GNAT family N-acyltransferase [Geoalkalibacter halelectricus]MDO3379685.1 GNAT family N-acetyltransferase [Geoalkalibacter halelectricus]UWZ78500.1 GNAT family N-acetyltransferase [Geoalkalibacter halelectricus]